MRDKPWFPWVFYGSAAVLGFALGAGIVAASVPPPGKVCAVSSRLVDPERGRYLLELDCGDSITEMKQVDPSEFDQYQVGDLYP